MQVAILGLGAVGGHICARLCAAGRDVTAIARGETYKALARGGLELFVGDTVMRCRPRVAASPESAGRHDLVIVALKANSLEPVMAGAIADLVKKDGAILFLQNGIPWWYAIGRDAGRLAGLDQTRFAEALLTRVPEEAILGGVVYSANAVRSPGVVVNNSPTRNAIAFGAVGRSDAARTGLVETAFGSSGMEIRAEDDIRLAVWQKLLIAGSMPALCIAADETPDGIGSSPAMRGTFAEAVRELARIAAAEGYDVGDAADSDAMLATMPRHMPSMVSDYLVGRTMELESALGAPRLLALDRCVPTPVLDTLDTIIEGRARNRLEAGQGAH